MFSCYCQTFCKNIAKLLRVAFSKNTSGSCFCCPAKQVFLKILQSLQENICAGVYFVNNVEGLQFATLFKKQVPAQVFSCEFCNFLNICAEVYFVNNVAGLQFATLFKKGTPAQVICCEFCKFFNICAGVYFVNNVAGLQFATLFKKETPAQVFPCGFCKFLRSSFS